MATRTTTTKGTRAKLVQAQEKATTSQS